MTFNFRTNGIYGEVEKERGVLYGSQPCQTDPSVGSGFNQQFELVMTEGLEARTKLSFHSLGTRCRPALQLICGKDTLLGLFPRSGLEKSFRDNVKQLRPQGGCGETESVCITKRLTPRIWLGFDQFGVFLQHINSIKYYRSDLHHLFYVSARMTMFYDIIHDDEFWILFLRSLV